MRRQDVRDGGYVYEFVPAVIDSHGLDRRAIANYFSQLSGVFLQPDTPGSNDLSKLSWSHPSTLAERPLSQDGEELFLVVRGQLLQRREFLRGP